MASEKIDSFPLVFMLVLIAGCAGHHSPVEIPTDSGGQAPAIASHDAAGGNRVVWGFWNVSISADRSTVDVIPDRIAAMHLNAVRLLEVAPCANCLTIENIVPNPPNELSADLRLRHPFPGLARYTGFDVRGVFISDGDYTFPVSGRMISLGDDLPRVLNPDGYTALFNPTDFPETDPPALGYIPGKFAPFTDLSATLNPFLAYRQDAPRRMFEAGGSETRTVHLRLPDGPFEFGYAVDCCWQFVQGPVTDPVNDFPPDANCLEAYQISVEVGPGLNLDCPAPAPIAVEVFDHQGLDSIDSVAVEAAELFAGKLSLSFSTVTGDESYLFTGTVANELGATAGEYPLLVRVVDTETDQNLGVVDAWHTVSVQVLDTEPGGWARTWGGVDSDSSRCVATDSSGNMYVSGGFENTVDFDPGDEVDMHTSNGDHDAFLSKFDSCGSFQWARTWGGIGDDYGGDVAVDGSGDVYIVGTFVDSVDFDPGPGIDIHGSNGLQDVYLSKFDSSGNFQWARTWGGEWRDLGEGLAVDSSGNVCVTGWFGFTVDFDPGPGTDIHIGPEWTFDVFLSKFDSSGIFQWARTWGGEYWQGSYGVAFDSSGNAYVVGAFLDIADFDPGPEIDEHVGNGGTDCFLSKFDASGTYQWVRTWGSPQDDYGLAIAVDDLGNVCCVGLFQEVVDFDPGPGTANYSANGEWDAFLSKFDSSGTFLWARTWGGTGRDDSWGVAVDASGNVYCTGEFEEVVDFDPGPGNENRSSNGSRDVFLSRFDASGEFVLARTWGGPDWDHGFGVASDSLGNVYVTGGFGSTVDFEPGPGSEYHISNGSGDAYLVKFLPDGYW